MFQLLEPYVTDRIAADASTLQQIFARFRLIKTKRKEFLLTPGKVCQHYYFVSVGCLRLFTINKDGEENTRYFAFEGSFGTGLPSLIDQQPVFEYIQTIELSELLVIHRPDFYDSGNNTPQFSLIYRQILEAALSLPKSGFTDFKVWKLLIKCVGFWHISPKF